MPPPLPHLCALHLVGKNYNSLDLFNIVGRLFISNFRRHGGFEVRILYRLLAALYSVNYLTLSLVHPRCYKQLIELLGRHRSNVVDPDPDRIRIQWGPWIRIGIRIRNTDPDTGGQKLPTKIEKMFINLIF
jgi:hypothetical protein